MGFILKTFGLKFSYYFPNLIFAAIMATLQHNYQSSGASRTTGVGYTATFSTPFLAANTLLYPYSRFAYQSFMDMFMGANVFILPLIIMLPFKLASMFFCWFFAVLLAPIGMIILWFHHAQEDNISTRDYPSSKVDDDWRSRSSDDW